MWFSMQKRGGDGKEQQHFVSIVVGVIVGVLYKLCNFHNNPLKQTIIPTLQPRILTLRQKEVYFIAISDEK